MLRNPLCPSRYPCSTWGVKPTCWGTTPITQAACRTSPGSRDSLGEAWDGHSMSKELFLFTAHDRRCPAPLLRLLKGSRSPCEGGTSCLPPKMHTEDSKNLSQLLGGSSGPFICSVHLTRMKASAGLWGLVSGVKTCFLISPGMNSTHESLTPPTKGGATISLCSRSRQNHSPLLFPPLFIQPLRHPWVPPSHPGLGIQQHPLGVQICPP